ncbi:hypothetical protein BCR44DRAFT_1440794 [Catenaria anguillulae PL171]|uniref:General transcription factor TFIIB n=1 Tax=Catenaria anguillulae PL171 TaxID=765915 RepID=A0A1Y2HGR8_9FUNG|nr:hypothetical protein BCR44DRAFT_1440794 [Catenaria anguillulae PL171]
MSTHGTLHPHQQPGQPSLAVHSVHSLPNQEIYASLNPKDSDSDKYHFKQGDLICATCGTVFKDRIIDTRSEWRTFSSDDGSDDPSRVGAAENKLMGKMNMETTIGDGRGTIGGSKDLSRTHAKTSTIRHNKVLTDGYRQIVTLGDQLNLQRNEVDTGKFCLYKMAEAGFAINKNIKLYCAVALLFGCRASGINFSMQEMADRVKAKKYTLRGSFSKLFCKVQPKLASLGQPLSKQTTIDEGVRASSGLDLPAVAASMVTHLCQEATNFEQLASRVPSTIIGAALWFVSHLIGHPKTLAEIAKYVKMGEPTIRNAYKVLYANRKTVMSVKMKEYDVTKLPLA